MNGTSSSAIADFGNTLQRLGLERTYLLDGTPHTGALSITSTSGFDYGQSVAGAPELEPLPCCWLGWG